ncbi:hypothetical protein DLEV_163 [Diachasmimorpha longicaudata entomopoxvirus]|uniref:Uncharacterized protein n=1 Tax=Diachasmimorpha longicaudata entomopoxvirus TaxID=109981 RepID=A0A7R5WMP9_9POXV|nr:hypothetical protein QKK69_gp163 [Diachasmimorpha longicaudata entomopoxvirus]AKS26454.1 hypothetical protein DLEV_163 [Diachasmimorpha longicaudata entomopoxvirus]
MATTRDLLKKLSSPLIYRETQIITENGEYLRKGIKSCEIDSIDEVKILEITLLPNEIEYSLFKNGISPSYDNKVTGGRFGYKIKDAAKIQGISITNLKPPYFEYLFKRLGAFLVLITDNDEYKNSPLSKVEGITFTYLKTRTLKIFICVSECLNPSEAKIVAEYFKKGLGLDPRYGFAYTEYNSQKYEFY